MWRGRPRPRKAWNNAAISARPVCLFGGFRANAANPAIRKTSVTPSPKKHLVISPILRNISLHAGFRVHEQPRIRKQAESRATEAEII
jgi:hypothetical protein